MTRLLVALALLLSQSACYLSHTADAAVPDAAVCYSTAHLTLDMTATHCPGGDTECSDVTWAFGSFGSFGGDTLQIGPIDLPDGCTCEYALHGVSSGVVPTLTTSFSEVGRLRVRRDTTGVELRVDTVATSVGSSDPTAVWIYALDGTSPRFLPDGVDVRLGAALCGDPDSPVGGARMLRVGLPFDSPHTLEAAPGDTVAEDLHHLGRWSLECVRTWDICHSRCGARESLDYAFVLTRDVPF